MNKMTGISSRRTNTFSLKKYDWITFLSFDLSACLGLTFRSDLLGPKLEAVEEAATDMEFEEDEVEDFVEDIFL